MKKNLELKGSNNVANVDKVALRQGLSHHSKYFVKFPEIIPGQDNTLLEIISSFSSITKSQKTIEEIYKCFNQYIKKLGYNFIGIAIPDKESGVLTVRTYNEGKKINILKFSLEDNSNYLVQTYVDKSRKFSSHKDLIDIDCPCLNEYLTIPLVFHGECYGIVIAGSMDRDRNRNECLNTLCSYLSLIASNYSLKNNLNSFCDFDNLTGLYTHRKFQETLSQVLIEAENNNKKVSVAIFDINNMAGINREFGHSFGDEVISDFAKMLKSNLRECDIAGRYGGDEIAVIMPDTENEKALLITKNIISKTSKQVIPQIGSIKANVGIATYPTTANNQEKLLVLAEQSMLISENNTHKNGKSFVLSSSDVNFWNKVALDSLSKVINKRNLHHTFNFEDELVKQLQDKTPSSKITLEVVTSLAAAIDAKDTYTRGHSQSVSVYAETLAKAVNLDEHMVERVKLAAILHDIGKIGISETILRKPGPLTDHEWEVMKQHPIIGVKKILEPIKSLNDLIPIVRHHHERMDGCGYPDRLKGDEIPIGARIVAIADAFHALISNRPYRKALNTEKTLEILRSGAGTQWDKELVDKFIAIIPSFYLTRR